MQPGRPAVTRGIIARNRKHFILPLLLGFAQFCDDAQTGRHTKNTLGSYYSQEPAQTSIEVEAEEVGTKAAYSEPALAAQAVLLCR
jgi:hypothetical protein